MTDAGAPRRGRHASPDDGWLGLPTSELASPARGVPVPRVQGAGQLPPLGSDGPSWAAPAGPAGPRWAADGAPWELGPATRPGAAPAEHLLGRVPGADDHLVAGGTARVLEDQPAFGRPQARHRPDDEVAGPADGTGPVGPAGAPAVPGGSGGSGGSGGGSHPSGPLPPFPPSAWSRLARRRAQGPREETQGGADPGPLPGEDTEAAALPPLASADEHGWDATGGLDVIGAHVDDHETDVHTPALDDAHLADHEVRDDHDLHDDLHEDVHHDEHDDDHHDEHDDDHGPLALDDDVPLVPYDPRRSRKRKRRRRVALLVSLVVLAGLALGIVLGGRQVLGLINPPDYTGIGTGAVEIRVQQGDSLKTIGQTMVDSGVIASVRPFVNAAKENPQATSISPGTYALRSHMSAQAALDLLLQPSSRLVSRVTLPEGLTAAVTLQKVAQLTRTPLDQLQAAAKDPAAIGLPAYAGGKVEGFLFPATYDFEPGTTPTQMLQQMVTRTEKALDGLAVPEDQRLKVLTEASIVQAEGKTPADMAKIARVLDNRIDIGMPLQLDTTVNYANGKNGVTTTAQDRANPSPYNTYVHPGLPPGPIGNPGEDALRAVLAPAQGSWLYFVVIDPDTGETRFATTPQEAQANTALFQQWLREHPGR